MSEALSKSEAITYLLHGGTIQVESGSTQYKYEKGKYGGSKHLWHRSKNSRWSIRDFRLSTFLGTKGFIKAANGGTS